jgi:site-specific recombinase XerD
MNLAPSAPGFPVLLQDFFSQRLMSQQNVSPRTIAAYRDTFRLLLRYFDECGDKRPADLTLADLDTTRILAFLDYLEKNRKNTVRSRNARLAAIRTFLRYAALRDPTSLSGIQRVLAIPMKRFDRPLLGYLSRQEVQAIVDAPDASTFSGHRDRVLFALMYNTGARVSEIAALCVTDISLEGSPSMRVHGKGRKERSVPLWKNTARQIKRWMKCISRSPGSPLLPNASGQPLTRSGIENRLKEAVRIASRSQPTLNGRRISPHTLRHTTAMHLLQAEVDITVIALWLGHESPVTTHMYIEADLALKERALGKLQEPPHKRLRYKPSDKLLQFLEGL